MVLRANKPVDSWSSIGVELGRFLKVKTNFHFQPFSANQSLFFLRNPSDRDHLLKIGVWSCNSYAFKFVNWSSKENLYTQSNNEVSSGSWVLIQGVPFSLWNQITFQTIGTKLGGLIQVSPFTANGWDISVMKLKVKGPLVVGFSKLHINFKPFPFSATVSLAIDQSENIISSFGRITIKKEELELSSTPKSPSQEEIQARSIPAMANQDEENPDFAVKGPAVDLSLDDFPVFATVQLGSKVSTSNGVQSQSLPLELTAHPAGASSAASPLRMLRHSEMLINGIIVNKGTHKVQTVTLDVVCEAHVPTSPTSVHTDENWVKHKQVGTFPKGFLDKMKGTNGDKYLDHHSTPSLSEDSAHILNQGGICSKFATDNIDPAAEIIPDTFDNSNCVVNIENGIGERVESLMDKRLQQSNGYFGKILEPCGSSSEMESKQVNGSFDSFVAETENWNSDKELEDGEVQLEGPEFDLNQKESQMGVIQVL